MNIEVPIDIPTSEEEQSSYNESVVAMLVTIKEQLQSLQSQIDAINTTLTDHENQLVALGV